MFSHYRKFFSFCEHDAREERTGSRTQNPSWSFQAQSDLCLSITDSFRLRTVYRPVWMWWTSASDIKLQLWMFLHCSAVKAAYSAFRGLKTLQADIKKKSSFCWLTTSYNVAGEQCRIRVQNLKLNKYSFTNQRPLGFKENLLYAFDHLAIYVAHTDDVLHKCL